jgi:hypothetical protein
MAMIRREFFKRARMALIGAAGLPALVKSFLIYPIPSQDLLLASLPGQLLLDLFGLGSGQIDKIGARLMSKLPPEEVLRIRTAAVAHARQGDHGFEKCGWSTSPWLAKLAF